MRECWTIIDKRTNKRATIATFFTEQAAALKIEVWRERQKAGGRPDVDAFSLAPAKCEDYPEHP